MFKYKVKAQTADRAHPITVALTNYIDLAEFIRDHAAESLDPTGEMGMTVEIITRPEADYFVSRHRDTEEG